ncbi:hypothetical protein TNCV_3510331 [Trichonephila clavipes]|nr:hypothetical protein TNCV_3510331 [Trichonephila clavipes]
MAVVCDMRSLPSIRVTSLAGLALESQPVVWPWGEPPSLQCRTPIQAPPELGKIKVDYTPADGAQPGHAEQLLGTEDAVQEYLDDMEDAENYRDRYIEMCTRVDLKIRETVVPTETEKEALNYRKSN